MPTITRLAALAQFDLNPLAAHYNGQWQDQEQAHRKPLMVLIMEQALLAHLQQDGVESGNDLVKVYGKHVLYVDLDSLSDAIVASAIGSIVLAGFALIAGMIYNSGMKPGRTPMFAHGRHSAAFNLEWIERQEPCP